MGTNMTKKNTYRYRLVSVQNSSVHILYVMFGEDEPEDLAMLVLDEEEDGDASGGECTTGGGECTTGGGEGIGHAWVLHAWV